jgi:hypothetical protein
LPLLAAGKGFFASCFQRKMALTLENEGKFIKNARKHKIGIIITLFMVRFRVEPEYVYDIKRDIVLECVAAHGFATNIIALL